MVGKEDNWWQVLIHLEAGIFFFLMGCGCCSFGGCSCCTFLNISHGITGVDERGCDRPAPLIISTGW
jgi:hypothetical protein